MGRSGIEFCCCAVPLVNAGAYLIALESLFVAICVVVLALATPQIVASMDILPSWLKPVVAVVGVLAILLHLFGIITIARESTTKYRAYIRIHFLLTLFVIVLTSIGTVWMFTQHDKAAAACTRQYGNEPLDSGRGIKVQVLSDTFKDTGEKICNYFTYAQAAACGALIALVGFTQLYMCLCQRAYGQKQREAAETYMNPPPTFEKQHGDSSTDKFDVASVSSSLQSPYKVGSSSVGGSTYGNGYGTHDYYRGQYHSQNRV